MYIFGVSVFIPRNISFVPSLELLSQFIITDFTFPKNDFIPLSACCTGKAMESASL